MYVNKSVMLVTLFVFYVIVGSASALGNFGKWLFRSNIIGFLFLPFMIIYYLINGNDKQKKEAVSILKAVGLFIIVFFFWYAFFSLVIR